MCAVVFFFFFSSPSFLLVPALAQFRFLPPAPHPSQLFEQEGADAGEGGASGHAQDDEAGESTVRRGYQEEMTDVRPHHTQPPPAKPSSVPRSRRCPLLIVLCAFPHAVGRRRV